MTWRAPNFLVMHAATVETEPLSSISLPNTAPSKNNGKNCARKRAALSMKVCVQLASSGCPPKAAAMSAATGATSKTLQPRNANHTRIASPTRMPRSPIVQHSASSTSMSAVERRPRSSAWALRNSLAACRPSSRNIVTNPHSALSFDEAPNLASASVMIRCVRICAQRAPSPVPGSATWRNRAIMRSSFISGELKEISLSRLRMFRRHDISGWIKAIWVIAMIVFPYITVLAYLIFQGQGMAERNVQQAQQARDELRRVVGFSVADEIQKLDGLKKAGSISDAEFARLRARLVSGEGGALAA